MKILRRARVLCNLILKTISKIIRGKYHPPLFIPFKLFNRYTLNRRIKLAWWYLDDSYSSVKPKVYTKERVATFINEIRAKKSFYYGETDLYFYQALEKYSVGGKNLNIIKSYQQTIA
ncbi:MAG: hypothetical protein NTW13_02030 [Candidatus Omnitrophica bacterium]|nr:hypothetical protein [Candidatus Omnitrophota bacterium]